MTSAAFPDKLQFLFEPARYKILHGGRGSGKSWGVARALLLEATRRPMRVLCARELQNSIADSVHKLLSDQIDNLGLGGFYTVQKTSISGINGSEFTFAGIKHNVSSIKSMEGISVAWVEEAEMVSKTSWETLIPTIRAEGSEIWVTFNPRLRTDDTYKRFVLTPPPDARVVKLNWSDNFWFPNTLRWEMEDLRSKDPDAWLNIWQGEPVEILQGAIYANELRAATEQGRITKVPYDPTKPVHTFWDLGWADSTSIWFAQTVGFETRVIDYLEDSQKPLQHYLQVLQGRGYVYGTDWLPHDARARQLGTGRSIEELMRAAGRTVRIVSQLSVADGINAARTVFVNCWFDESKTTDGLNCLRNYQYEKDERMSEGTRIVYKKEPLHNWASHGADAFRMMAVAMREKTDMPLKLPVPKPVFIEATNQSWMGI